MGYHRYRMTVVVPVDRCWFGRWRKRKRVELSEVFLARDDDHAHQEALDRLALMNEPNELRELVKLVYEAP